MQRGHVLYQFWIPMNKLDNLMAVCICNSVHLFEFFTSVYLQSYKQDSDSIPTPVFKKTKSN